MSTLSLCTVGRPRSKVDGGLSFPRWWGLCGSRTTGPTVHTRGSVILGTLRVVGDGVCLRRGERCE